MAIDDQRIKILNFHYLFILCQKQFAMKCEKNIYSCCLVSPSHMPGIAANLYQNPVRQLFCVFYR